MIKGSAYEHLWSQIREEIISMPRDELINLDEALKINPAIDFAGGPEDMPNFKLAAIMLITERKTQLFIEEIKRGQIRIPQIKEELSRTFPRKFLAKEVSSTFEKAAQNEQQADIGAALFYAAGVSLLVHAPEERKIN